MKIHGFYGYGFYNEQKKLTHETVIITNSCKADVKVDSDSKNIITITDKGLLAKLGLEVVPSNGQNLLKLTDVAHGNAEIASVEYPLIKSIDGGSYDSETKEIKLNISLIGGETDEIVIDVADLVTLYKQGQGISISDDNKISIKLDENNNDALTLTDDGLGINLSGYATTESVESAITGVEEALEGKQDKLTAGDGILIADNVISVTASTPSPKLYEIVLSLEDVTDPRPNIIYLVPQNPSGETNHFIEYIWVNRKWEELGPLPEEIDLSNYYTKDEVNGLLAGKANKSYVDEALSAATVTVSKANGERFLDVQTGVNASGGVDYILSTSGVASNADLRTVSANLQTVSATADSALTLAGSAKTIADNATIMAENNSARINELSGKVEQNETNIGVLSGNVEENTTNITNLTAEAHERLDNLEGSVSAISASVDNVIEALDGKVNQSEFNVYSGAVADSLDLMNANIQSAFTMIDEETEARTVGDADILTRLQVLTPRIEKTESGYTYNPPQSQHEGGVFDEVWWLVHNGPTGSGVTHIESSDSSVTITYDSETNTYDLKVDVDTDSLWDKGLGEGSIRTNDTLNARNKNEVAVGSYNLSLQSGETFNDGTQTAATATSNTVFSVGIGNDPRNRKNALEVRDDGTIWMWVEDQFMNVTDLLGQIAHETDEYQS